MRLKITGGNFKGRLIDAPKGEMTRPTCERLRQTVFDIIAPDIESAVFIDAYSGSGAMAIEACSRGASKIFAIEQNRIASRTIVSNLAKLEISDEVQLMECECLKGLKALEKKVSCDLIFLDPPYPKTPKELEQFNELFKFMDESSLFHEKSRIFFELPLKNSQINLDPYSKLYEKKRRKVGSSTLVELSLNPS